MYTLKYGGILLWASPPPADPMEPDTLTVWLWLSVDDVFLDQLLDVEKLAFFLELAAPWPPP